MKSTLTPSEPPTTAQIWALGLSQAYASELANGKKTPSLQVAKRIERELGWPVGSWPIERERTAA